MSREKEQNKTNGGTRAGASVGESEKEDMRDLFLSEEKLVRLAIGHLQGKRPPQNPTKKSSGAPLAQSARLRRHLAKKLKRELVGRGWTTLELAENSALSVGECRALEAAALPFTPEVAEKLSQVFATSSDYWQKEGD